MATLTVTDVTSTTVWIRITGVSRGDTIRVFVRLASEPSDITYNKEDLEATSSTFKLKIDNNSDGIYHDLEPDTEYLVNYKVNGGNWLGAVKFTTKSEAQRPWDWAWWSTIRQGGKIGLSAGEWNEFTNRINEFRLYQGLSEYNFTYVSRGDPIAASVVNEAYYAIQSLSGHGTLPSRARTGRAITAAFFNDLKDALNYVD